MEESLDLISPILPIDFFSFSLQLKEVEWKKKLQKKHEIPNFSSLICEKPFSKVRMGWNIKGLCFEIEIDKIFEEAFFPDYRKGDSVEIFLDTRDRKTGTIPTRFCHHFVFLPVLVDGSQVWEIDLFRTDDRHPLVETEKIEVQTEFSQKGYQMRMVCPAETLYGFEPLSFDRLGFSYRINGKGKNPNHFTVSSSSLDVQQHPSRWVSMQLKK